jgi:hypothetical protein
MTNGMTGALYRPPALTLPNSSSAGARRNWTLTNLLARFFEATPEEQEDDSHDKRQHVR